MTERKLFYDEDPTALIARCVPGTVRDQVTSWFEYLFSLDIDVLGYCCLESDLSFVRDIPSAERVGSRVKYFEKIQTWTGLTNLRELWAQGTDVMRLACQAARKRGKMVLGQMRMSDSHHAGELERPSDDLMCPQVVLDHPEWRIFREQLGYKDWLLDFSFPEVRAMKLRELRELAENYDIDGLQLGWMRACRHFAPSKQREKAPILTDFVKDVRRMLDEAGKRKGRRLLLVHQVASDVDENLSFGCDIGAWVKRGLADVLQPMEFLHADYSIRTDDFVTLCQGTDCGVYPTVQDALGGGKEAFQHLVSRMTVDNYRAMASNFYAWGAHGCSVFNFCTWGYDPLFQKKMEEAVAVLASPQRAAGGLRYYHYLPTCKWGGGRTIGGRENAQRLQFRSDELGKRLAFKFRMADGRDGKKLSGHLWARITDATPLDAFELDINGVRIPPEKIDVTFWPMGEDNMEHSTPALHAAGLRLEVKLVDCPPFAGDNELGVRWTRKNWQVSVDPNMEILQVYVKD